MGIISREDFGKIVTDNYADFCKFARRYVKNKSYANDCVHDAIIKVMDKIDCMSFDSVDRYIYKAIKNTSSRYGHVYVMMDVDTSEYDPFMDELDGYVTNNLTRREVDIITYYANVRSYRMTGEHYNMSKDSAASIIKDIKRKVISWNKCRLQLV